MSQWIEWSGYSFLMLLFAVVPIKKALHMFQQNRYELQRYTAWLKKTELKLNHWQIEMLACVAVLVLLPKPFNFFLIIMASLILIYQQHKVEYIKPLVYTARVKRQITMMVILFLFFAFLIGRYSPMPFVVGGLFAMASPWILIYAMHIITLPIENAIKWKYEKEARNRLNGHQRLIKIGITGSYGKTSSKNVVQSLLSQKYYSLMTPASFNTPMGITRTIREQLKPIHEVFICEMGADHVGDIQELCDFVNPRIGVVTSIGPQHLNTFKTMENIIQEKMKIIESLPADGVGILNIDNQYIRRYKVKNKCRLVRYGIHHQEGDYFVKNIEYTAQGSKFTVVFKEGEVEFETKLLGEHNIANILAALAIAKELNMSWTEMRKAVKELNYVEHRLEIKKINGYTFVDNAFNSNPSGAAMSLEVLKMMPGKRVVITPGMIDLGEQQDQQNKEFGAKMKDKADLVILVGEQQTKAIKEGLEESGFDMNNVRVCKSVKEAFTLVYKLATPEDTILLENDLPDAFSH